MKHHYSPLLKVEAGRPSAFIRFALVKGCQPYRIKCGVFTCGLCSMMRSPWMVAFAG